MINDTYVTVVGNVVDDPRYFVTASGAQLASFRLASTSRRFDRELGQWRDGDTLFLGVSCWRNLGDNVAGSVSKGDPVIAAGRLRVRSYTTEQGHKRVVTEIDADAVGHNLARGVARFRKGGRSAAAERNGAGDQEQPWAREASSDGLDDDRSPARPGTENAGESSTAAAPATPFEEQAA